MPVLKLKLPNCLWSTSNFPNFRLFLYLSLPLTFQFFLICFLLLFTFFPLSQYKSHLFPPPPPFFKAFLTDGKIFFVDHKTFGICNEFFQIKLNLNNCRSLCVLFFGTSDIFRWRFLLFLCKMFVPFPFAPIHVFRLTFTPSLTTLRKAIARNTKQSKLITRLIVFIALSKFFNLCT